MGTDTAGKERDRFLTAVRETKREGLLRTFDATSQLEPNQLKLSKVTLRGAWYFCTEKYVDEKTRKICVPVVNLGWGKVDMRDPKRPCIAGTWEQLRLPKANLKSNM